MGLEVSDMPLHAAKSASDESDYIGDRYPIHINKILFAHTTFIIHGMNILQIHLYMVIQMTSKYTI